MGRTREYVNPFILYTLRLKLTAVIEPVDYILFLTLDPTMDPSPNEVSDVKWVSKQELEAFFAEPCSFLSLTPSPFRLLSSLLSSESLY